MPPAPPDGAGCADDADADEAAARMALGEFYFAHGLIEYLAAALLVASGQLPRGRLDRYAFAGGSDAVVWAMSAVISSPWGSMAASR